MRPRALHRHDFQRDRLDLPRCGGSAGRAFAAFYALREKRLYLRTSNSVKPSDATSFSSVKTALSIRLCFGGSRRMLWRVSGRWAQQPHSLVDGLNNHIAYLGRPSGPEPVFHLLHFGLVSLRQDSGGLDRRRRLYPTIELMLAWTSPTTVPFGLFSTQPTIPSSSALICAGYRHRYLG